MYYGWIPNVSGYLSFSHIGGLPIRQRVVSESVFPATRLQKGSDTVSILQVRSLSDRPEVGPIKPDTRAGLHHFLLQAKLEATGNRRRLIGVVISAPAELSDYLVATHSSVEEGKLAIDSTLADRYQALLDHLKSSTPGGHYCLSFALDDDGVIAFESLANASPTDPNGALLALEAYFFVKDLLHKHRFHNSSDDSLLELTEASGVTDPDWYHSVMRNLHRSVISSFRSVSKVAQAHALGKLAYLESFFGVLEQRGLPLGPKLSTNTLRAALEQHQACAREQDEQRNLLVSYLLWAVGVAIPIFFVSLQLLQIPCIEGINATADCRLKKFEIPPTMVNVTAFVLKQLDYLVVASVLIFAAAMLGLWAKRLFRYAEVGTSQGSIIGDLRELFLRLYISHPRFAKVLLAFIALALVVGTAFAIRLLLQ